MDRLAKRMRGKMDEGKEIHQEMSCQFFREHRRRMKAKGNCYDPSKPTPGFVYNTLDCPYGIKVWFYVRYNEATLRRLATDPQGVADGLLLEDKVRRQRLGDWYYIVLRPARVSQPASSSTWVTSLAWSGACWRNAQSGSYILTNAEQEAWYAVFVGFAAHILDRATLATKMTVEDVEALRRMVCNPTAYAPAQEEDNLHRLSLWLIAHNATSNLPLLEVRDKSIRIWRDNGGKGVLPANHNTFVAQVAKGKKNLERILEQKGKVPEIIKLEHY
ncbi:hypothetical protein CALCODRAFT_544708, partial [Calocera cornea HHB12733]